jgi:signal transduction histidine kinase
VFQQHEIHVTSNLAESVPRLYADSGSLQRVMINLLNNAVDAMYAGGTLTVASRLSPPSATSRPGRGVIVEVQDTGIGIPAEILPTVFELFTTTKAPGKGTGLGLGICQEIVKAHGGSLKLKSQEGQGTCVRVFLPIQVNDPLVRTEETV